MAARIPSVEKSLQHRTATSSSLSDAIYVPFTTKRPHIYREYGITSIEKAYEAVKNGKLTIRRAAEEYGVPRSTLHDRVAGKVSKTTTKSGPKCYLTKQEEKKLVEFLIGCASIGYAKSMREVLTIAERIVHLHDDKKDIHLSKGWWDKFCKRHPEISLRRAEPLSYARAVANNHAIIEHYFDVLQKVIEGNRLGGRPGQIFNCDETGMPLSPRPPKVAARIGQHPYAITTGDKSQITVLACASASGYTIPPMVIFDRKHLQAEMATGEVPGTFYGLSDTGWMDSELFHKWFVHHFLVHAPPKRPLLLLMDGHTSHYDVHTLDIAAKEGIVIYCLPPHTTHILQPLDNGAFSSLKHHWMNQCSRFIANNPGKVITRRNFMQVFRPAWEKGMSMSNVIGCFKAAGVYPVDRSVVLSQLDAPNTVTESREGATPAPFVPFYTPKKSRTATDQINSTPSPGPTVKFSTEEMRMFESRFKESTEERYSLWLATFYPQKSHKTEASLEKILQLPTPPATRHPTRSATQFNSSSRVLTSEECIQALLEKDKKKKEKKEEKEKRQLEREEKRKEREEKKKENDKKKAERDEARKAKTQKIDPKAMNKKENGGNKKLQFKNPLAGKMDCIYTVTYSSLRHSRCHIYR